jgi:methanol metabolism-related c-type cytochrome
MRLYATMLAASVLALGAQAVTAADLDPIITDTEASYEEGGRWYTEEGVPTFKIAEDGTVDFPTFSGFRRYNAECFQCHGPDGAGGSYAPALQKSVMQMDYYQFYDIVVNGKQEVNAAQNLVMPSLGDNPNVMCYLDDIYSYLRARGTDELGRGRPAKKAAKSDAFAEAEDACMG